MFLQIQGATLVQVMAGLGYSQKSAKRSIFVTDSSWGRAARAPWIFKNPGRSSFVTRFCSMATSARSESPQARLTVADSVRRNSEVNRDLRLRLHGFRAYVVRLEMPLAYRFLCGSGQNRRAAHQSEFLDQPVATDHRQHDH